MPAKASCSNCLCRSPDVVIFPVQFKIQRSNDWRSHKNSFTAGECFSITYIEEVSVHPCNNVSLASIDSQRTFVLKLATGISVPGVCRFSICMTSIFPVRFSSNRRLLQAFPLSADHQHTLEERTLLVSTLSGSCESNLMTPPWHLS